MDAVCQGCPFLHGAFDEGGSLSRFRSARPLVMNSRATFAQPIIIQARLVVVDGLQTLSMLS
jgi:hypothetical protein